MLEGSAMGMLLPTLVSAVTALFTAAAPEGGGSLECSQDVADSLVPVMTRTAALLRRLPREKLVVPEGSDGPPAKPPQCFETAHPYENNTNQTFEIAFPGATRITISFDERCRTESNYDNIVFYRDESRTERWHTEEKYSGRYADF
ncbi:unnamed protein product, partial [Phaeothamnion confervicola]